MLPFDKRTLVREPDFRFDLQGSLIFDPDTRVADTGRKLDLALRVLLLLCVLACREGGEERGEAGGATEWALVDCVGAVIIAIGLFVRGPGALFDDER